MDIKLNRQVFDREKFKNTINTDFKELNSQVDPSFYDLNLATVDDFFTLYNKYFFEIPKEGEVNSHVFLVKESTEYTNFVSNQEEIDELIREINDLREENTQLREDQASLIEEFTSTFNNQ